MWEFFPSREMGGNGERKRKWEEMEREGPIFSTSYSSSSAPFPLPLYPPPSCHEKDSILYKDPQIMTLSRMPEKLKYAH